MNFDKKNFTNLGFSIQKIIQTSLNNSAILARKRWMFMVDFECNMLDILFKKVKFSKEFFWACHPVFFSTVNIFSLLFFLYHQVMSLEYFEKYTNSVFTLPG